MSEIQLQIKEATGADAKAVLAVSQQLGEETDFLLMDESGLALPEALLAEQLDAIYDRDDYLLLLAFDQEQLIAMASVKGHEEWQLAHVGEIGISILKEYWGLGLGSLLIEELLDWVVEVGELTRIELTVQARNLRAIHLYQKFGFLTEGCMKEAVQTREGQKVDVLMMARLFES
ncbi:GNAT family N-acetyltransferase [Enterococcus casseliflavus]|uniref:GNAT family N-acetyltransferase n=1 Tax=Enterococcus casseliflavus TaxID=37734 RepID=UPI00232AF0F5|nr:GNAT family N-acetyltransferase [Enterococcus casseliflavus]MDB1690856.1 GNAT family N-acetyltransferase [Enterococcus casseliflavus]